MSILQTIWFLVVILPFVMLKEGYKKAKNHMDKYHLWGYVPYFLLFFLIGLLVILLLNGYRF